MTKYDKPQRSRLNLRVAESDVDRWTKAAYKEGKSLSQWLKDLANRNA